MNTERNLQQRLQQAVRGEAAPPHLAAQIRHRLEAEEKKLQGRRIWLWPLAASMAAATVTGVIWLRRDGRPEVETTREEMTYTARVSARVSPLMRIGLGDHIHCALYRKHPEGAPTIMLPKRYLGLLEMAKRQAPEGYSIAHAHQCAYGDRLFVHLVLSRDKDLLSLVLTERQSGDGFDPKTLVQGLQAAGVSFYAEDAVDFRVAAYATEKHLVYLISAWPEAENNKLLAAVARDVQSSLPNI